MDKKIPKQISYILQFIHLLSSVKKQSNRDDSFKEGTNYLLAFTNPNSMSVDRVLSCASSTITTLQKINGHVKQESRTTEMEAVNKGVRYSLPVACKVWFTKEFSQEHSISHVFQNSLVRCAVFKPDRVTNLKEHKDMN